MSDEPMTKIMVPVDMPDGVGMLEFDVRELGFLCVEELLADPDLYQYVEQAITLATAKRIGK